MTGCCSRLEDEPPRGACNHYVNADGKCFVAGCWNHA
jgi:hypothetical protein